MHNTLFSFDMGTNSIGWCIFALNAKSEPYRIVDAGVRIFSDGREPKSGNSLAEGRRIARGMSRRRERYKRRRKAVLRTLSEYGLMPVDTAARHALVSETRDRGRTIDPFAQADVYNLRSRALDAELPPFHVGRALFHLNQRRGFKSNRKTDKRSNEKGAIELGAERLHLAIKEARARTLGEFLAGRRGYDPAQLGQVRVRAGSADAEDTVPASAKQGYDFYPQRKMLEDEFNAIWHAQARFQPHIYTEERRAHLFRVTFFQRELKPQKPGKCSFNSLENRLPRAHPLFQTFRLYKEVNELELVLPDLSQRKLSPDERDNLIRKLRSTRKVTYGALRQVLKLGSDIRFNKETESRKDMAGDEVSAALSAKDAFANAWSSLSLDAQWEVVSRLREEQDSAKLHRWLVETHALSEGAAEVVASIDLPEGYGRLGPSALSSLLDHLVDGTDTDENGRQVVISEAKAAERAGYDHALARQGEGLDRLPKYQEVLERRIPPGSGESGDPYDVRMGRITNPTVHIGLNQLRRLVNRLIARHGKPNRIALELARELNQSDEQKKKINTLIARNTRDAERRSQKLREEIRVADNGYNRMLLRLWEDLNKENPLDRRCVYSGTVITVEMLFSGAVDIDHILPWSRSLDDSQGNRILCTREANRQKGNCIPSEVPQWMDRYDDILERAARLPENKRWRFARDAMEQFEKNRDFLDRQLTDTQYLARLAHDYLGALYGDEEPDGDGVLKRRNHVIVVTGQMTEMLRRKWGLNNLLHDHNYGQTAKGKNRKDHRHHAIDAAVIGVSTRSLLQKIATAAARNEENGAEDALRHIDPPWPSFREELKAVAGRIIVSHKPDRGTLPANGSTGPTVSRLHNDTAYGLTGQTDENGNMVVVRRKPFLSLTDKDIPSIRDGDLKAALDPFVAGLSGAAFTQALMKFQKAEGPFHRIRRVRLVDGLNVIAIRDKEGRPYKGYMGGSNYRYDVWELSDGQWDAEVVSMFDAHQPGWKPAMREKHHNARKVLSLRQNDMVAYQEGDTRIIARVRKFGQNKQIWFDGHLESGNLSERHKDVDDPFRDFSKMPNGLKQIGLRQIRVDETGRVFDPGPQDAQSRAAKRSRPHP